MAASTLLFRAGKKFVGSLPAWLIRFRPFGVYEVLLTVPVAPTTTTESRVGRLPLACQIKWVESSDEAATLRRVANRENVSAWNQRTRRAAVVSVNGEAIACAWIAMGAFEESELGLIFKLQPTEAWLFAAVVEPQWRNQGVYRQLLEFVINELSRSALRRILLGVTLGNEPSRRAHVCQGATQVGAIFALRILGVTLCLGSGKVRLPWRMTVGWRRPINIAIDR